MASPWAVSLDDDEEKDAPGSDFRTNTKDAVVFLIDARKCMLATNGEGEVFLHNAMRAAVQTLKAKIVATPTDLVGIWFYGTVNHKNGNAFEGVYEAIELGPPSASAIKLVESMTLPADDPNRFDFEGVIGSLPADAPSPLHHALWAASMSLAAKAKEGDDQRIWLFTCDDDPNADDPVARSQSIQKAKDLADMDQDITLWYMAKPGTTFNTRKFFAGIVPIVEDEEDMGAGMHDVSRMSDIVSFVRRKEYKKRAYGRIPFKIAEGVELSVGVYNLIYPAKKPYAVQLETDSNQQVKTETNWVCADTGKTLLPHEIRTYHTFAQSKVIFTKDDMKEIKNFGEPSIRLMGFKPKSVLKDEINLRSPYFLYPNEDGVTGSTVAFRALQEKMIELGKVAIVRLVMRAGSAPRFCALVPQKEVVDEYGEIESPAGMFMIPLPFADDIRTVHAPAAGPPATDEQIAAAKKVVQCLDAPQFSSYDFDNPVLQKHYAAVQALALTENNADWDDTDDLVVPDYAGMAKFHPVVAEFRETFGGSADAAPAKRAPAKKRARATGGASASGGGRATKKARGGAAADDGDVVDVPAMATAGKLSKLKVPELKAWMQANGLKPKGRKADLIAAIEAHLG